jgi:hypothetical protein
VDAEPGQSEKVRALYRKILARDPSAHELEGAANYLAGATLDEYAQILLSTNEEIFWQ